MEDVDDWEEWEDCAEDDVHEFEGRVAAVLDTTFDDNS